MLPLPRHPPQASRIPQYLHAADAGWPRHARIQTPAGALPLPAPLFPLPAGRKLYNPHRAGQLPLMDREMDHLYGTDDDGARKIRDGGTWEEGEHPRTTSAMIHQ